MVDIHVIALCLKEKCYRILHFIDHDSTIESNIFIVLSTYIHYSFLCRYIYVHMYLLFKLSIVMSYVK